MESFMMYLTHIKVWHNSHVFPIKPIIFECLDNNLCISEISKGSAYAVTNNYLFYRSSSRFINRAALGRARFLVCTLFIFNRAAMGRARLLLCNRFIYLFLCLIETCNRDF